MEICMLETVTYIVMTVKHLASLIRRQRVIVNKFLKFLTSVSSELVLINKFLFQSISAIWLNYKWNKE